MPPHPTAAEKRPARARACSPRREDSPAASWQPASPPPADAAAESTRRRDASQHVDNGSPAELRLLQISTAIPVASRLELVGAADGAAAPVRPASKIAAGPEPPQRVRSARGGLRGC